MRLVTFTAIMMGEMVLVVISLQVVEVGIFLWSPVVQVEVDHVISNISYDIKKKTDNRLKENSKSRTKMEGK